MLPLGLLEQQRSLARPKLADILVRGFDDGGCSHRCGFTSKYAYAYMSLLQEKYLFPDGLLCISNAITAASNMPDPVPQEASVPCNYERNHTVPEYRRNRG